VYVDDGLLLICRNIANMKKQLNELGCSFDWQRVSKLHVLFVLDMILCPYCLCFCLSLCSFKISKLFTILSVFVLNCLCSSLTINFKMECNLSLALTKDIFAIHVTCNMLIFLLQRDDKTVLCQRLFHVNKSFDSLISASSHSRHLLVMSESQIVL